MRSPLQVRVLMCALAVVWLSGYKAKHHSPPAVVALYKSLGGGWKDPDSDEAANR